MIAGRFTGAWSLVVVSLVVALASWRPAADDRVVVVADVDLEIVDDVTFVGAPRALTISTRSLRALDALAHTLREDPGIARVEVQAATADAAQLCIDYLIGQGVDPARLAAGLHDTRRRAPTVAFRPDSQP